MECIGNAYHATAHDRIDVVEGSLRQRGQGIPVHTTTTTTNETASTADPDKIATCIDLFVLWELEDTVMDIIICTLVMLLMLMVLVKDS